MTNKGFLVYQPADRLEIAVDQVRIGELTALSCATCGDEAPVTARSAPGQPVLGQVERGAGGVSYAEQQHSSAGLVEPAKRRGLTEVAIQLVSRRAPFRARAARGERGLRVAASRGTRQGPDILRAHSH